MDEIGFLDRITGSPSDDETRQVYADWLEERDDPRSRRRAAFLRAQVHGSPPSGWARWWPSRSTRRGALGAIRQLGAEWLARVDRTGLAHCGALSFSFECPERWEDLQPTDSHRVRRCATCEAHVHYCESVDEARAHAAQGHCVAVCSIAPRTPVDLPAGRRMGRLAPEQFRRKSQRR